MIEDGLSIAFTDTVTEKLRGVCRTICAEVPVAKLTTLADLLGRSIGSVYEEFKDSPYTTNEAGQDVVRGSGHQLAPTDVLYLTKLDAMRDPRPIFDAIRTIVRSTSCIIITRGCRNNLSGDAR